MSRIKHSISPALLHGFAAVYQDCSADDLGFAYSPMYPTQHPSPHQQVWCQHLN